MDVHKPPPFADSSCRREPDLEHPYPVITGLCRLNKTRRFKVGERVAYFTVGRPHRLAAILLVLESFETHAAALTGWYEPRGVGLPRNLMVPGNRALRFGLTCGFYTNADRSRVRPDPTAGRTQRRLVREWEGLYRERRVQAPHAHACQRVFFALHDPPELTEEAARKVFPKRRFPGTQTPAKVDEGVIDALVAALGIKLGRVCVPPHR